MTVRKSQDVAREAIAKNEVVYHNEAEAKPTDYNAPPVDSPPDIAQRRGKASNRERVKADPFAHGDYAQVVLPKVGRNERAFASETGAIIGPLEVAFLHNDRVAEIYDEPVPVVTEEQHDRNNLAKGGLKFRTMTGIRTKGWIEQYLTTGIMIKEIDAKGAEKRTQDGKPVWKFAEKTMGKDLAAALLENPFFQKQLPRISRILPVPVPIQIAAGEIKMPWRGYNKDLEIYCALDAPVTRIIDIESALKFLKQAHAGFEFTSPQSQTHAYARFLTPFFRGIIGYGEPVPCWFFNANRPRCGKDYLAGITQITYEGFPFEDAAIGDKPEETCKRITAGLMAGRRFFHFANCQGYLQDKYFIQAITDMIWRDRLMGGNSAANDLQIPNEAEYSISANQGLTCRDDVPPRVRKIGLAFYDEDANNRVFPVEDLHGWARANRSTLLSAAFSIFNYWKKQGMPQGKPYSSFKRWGRIIGGVMQSVELGDPTLPDSDDMLFGGDMREDAMVAFYELAYEHRPDLWTAKKEFYTLVAEHQDNDDRLLWFGDFSGEKKKSAQTKLGKTITEFQGRILAGGIQMVLDRVTKETQKWRLLFTKKR